GIEAFELWDREVYNSRMISDVLRSTNCCLAIFCANRQHSAVDPSARTCFLSEVGRNLEAARKVHTPGLGVLRDGRDARGIPITPSSNLSRSQKIENLYESLQSAVPLAEAANTVLLLEPLNSQIDHPGFTLDSSGDAFAIVRDLGSRSLKVLFDVYHM